MKLVTPRKTWGYGLVILLGGFLFAALLISCEQKPAPGTTTQPGEKTGTSLPPSQVQPEKKSGISSGAPTIQPSKETTTQSDPAEAKKKQLAESIKEIVNLREQVNKNPKLMDEPATQEKGENLSKQIDALLKELTGGNRSEEDTLMIEIIKKYAPEHLEFVETMLASKKQAQVVTTKAQMRNIQVALEQYRRNNGKYPSTEEGLDVLNRADDPTQPTYLAGDEPLKDQWGNSFIYTLVNPNEFVLKSSGPDGKEDTPDDIKLE